MRVDRLMHLRFARARNAVANHVRRQCTIIASNIIIVISIIIYGPDAAAATSVAIATANARPAQLPEWPSQVE